MSLLMKNELELTLGIFSSFLLNLKGIYQDKLKRILQILSYNLIENKKVKLFPGSWCSATTSYFSWFAKGSFYCVLTAKNK